MTLTVPRHIPLAHLPTPLWRHPALNELVGCELWVKRDDMTGGAESGNKIRKLEYLLQAAHAKGALAVITCGGAQSNHARATALCARRLGMRSVLFLREVPATISGNLMLDQLAGAEIRAITRSQYADRAALMAQAAEELEQAGETTYIIPEGGSNGLGAFGYVQAALEIREQLDLGLAGELRKFDWAVCACGSGGTAAGLALGVGATDIAAQVTAVAVCDSRGYFETVTQQIIEEAQALEPSLPPPAPLVIEDGYIGPGYGVMSDEQKAFLIAVAQQTGLVLDPVYSGKALFALSQLKDKPRNVLFVHTGGLPGLLAQADDFAPLLAGSSQSG
jgi:D-cysteine desulfhydrase